MDPSVRWDDGVYGIAVSFLRLPAVRAALIQAVAFVPTLLIVYAAARAGFAPGFAAAALIQGGIATIASALLRLPPWWLPIQFLFPVLLLSGQSLAIPAWVWLAAFLALLALYWSTYRTRVPYYPSNRAAWDAFESVLPEGRALRVIDIGSGLGGLTLHLSRKHPGWTVMGIELAPLPWLVSRLRAVGSRAGFVRGDYAALDFAQYDAVFAYLSPAAMPALWEKARREMRPGSLLASYEFVIPGHRPAQSIPVKDTNNCLFVWNF